MRISHRYKFILISVPKTGSTTCRKFLDPISDIKSNGSNKSPFYDHTTAVTLREHFKTNSWDWDSYFKFGFVRNPWDWMVSHWFYRSKFVKNFQNNKYKAENWCLNFYKTCKNQIEGTVNFSDWCQNYGIAEFDNQSEWLFDNSNNRLVDYIGRVEDFQTSLDYICETIKLDKIKVKIKNSTNHAKYNTYYTPHTRESVAKKFHRDIELFGYTFEE